MAEKRYERKENEPDFSQISRWEAKIKGFRKPMKNPSAGGRIGEKERERRERGGEGKNAP